MHCAHMPMQPDHSATHWTAHSFEQLWECFCTQLCVQLCPNTYISFRGVQNSRTMDKVQH